MRRAPWLIACSMACLALAAPTLAQDQVETYTPDFFADSRPATAMDMINRLPGFNFDGGSGSRGLSGNAGNVLVNGKRPTSKSEGLSTILSRILAGAVVRIEVIHGGAPGIDMQGKPVVANIIRTDEPSSSLVAIASATYLNTDRVLPSAQLQYSRTDGDRSYDLTVRRDANYNSDMGEARITRIDAAGNAVPVEETRRGTGGNVSVSGAMATPLAGGDLDTNVNLQQSDFDSGTLYDDPSGPQNYASTSHHRNGEVGANYALELGDSELNLQMLQRLGHSVSTQILADDNGMEERFSSLQATGESVSRVTLRYPLSPALTVEGGAEAAYNFLEGSSRYTQDGVVVSVPSSNVEVSEKRGEAFLQSSWQIDDALALDAGARAEYSVIGEEGDAGKSRSFFYLKPRALLTWTIDPSSLLRLRVERQVGQLNFGDFISSASLTQDNVTAGNPDLKPDQRWQVELAYQYQFWDRGAVTLALQHQQLSNILDSMPLFADDGTVYDVRGNIGSGRDDSVSLDVALPTDRLGVKGGLLTAGSDWRDSALTDPLTGQTRRFSGERVNSYSVGFSQDLTGWRSTWSVSWSNGWQQAGYHVTRMDRTFGDPSMSASWTYKPQSDLNLTFSVNDLLTSGRTRFSDYFDGPRNASPLARREVEVSYIRPRLFLSVRKTFD
jgi:outer membrane receptor protein involved in Fe transport